VIAFGCSITEPAPYREYSEPGIRLAAEPDSAIYAFAAVGSIQRSYNLLLDVAATRDDLEALVIVHPHLEITDPELCSKIRRVFADPEVAVAGAAGASGVSSLGWWKGDVSSPAMTFTYQDHGGGVVPAYSWAGADRVPREVDTIDGSMLVLSPWAVRNVRFDEELKLGYGFDLDYCLQVGQAGRKVVTGDFHATYHSGLDLLPDPETWIEMHIRIGQKWEGRMPGEAGEGASSNGSWKARARRAEAKCEAARAVAYSNALQGDARVFRIEQALHERERTLSWRLTRPLRELNLVRRGARPRLGGGAPEPTPRNSWWR
jgi:hypothetical protein